MGLVLEAPVAGPVCCLWKHSDPPTRPHHTDPGAMPRYTIEELFKLKPAEDAVVQPVNFDAVEFRALIEKVKQLQALREEEYHSAHPHGHFNRRRSSHLHGRPKVKHNKPKVTTDEEGWSTFEPKGSAVTEDGEASSEENGEGQTGSSRRNNKSNESLVQETVRVRPNNKNISSSRPADNRDIITDKQTKGFNAFAALESESESEDE